MSITPIGLYEDEETSASVDDELEVARYKGLRRQIPLPEPVRAEPPPATPGPALAPSPPPEPDPVETYRQLRVQDQQLAGEDALSQYRQLRGRDSMLPGTSALQQFKSAPVTPEGVGRAVMTVASSPRPAGLSSDIIPNQFDSGLSTEDAYAACGPVAAVSFARATGRNPTVEEAKNLAASVGWTPQRGMAGPRSQKALLDKMGVPAMLEEGAPDWNKVRSDVEGGNPVTISTPGHYFVAAGYDPETGRFDFGHSGTALRGGRRWMTPQELAQSGQGQPHAALYLDNPETPQRSVAATPQGGTGGQFDDVFRRYAGDLARDDQFIAVVRAGTKAESGENPNSTSGDNGKSWGLFQIHEVNGKGDWRLDPDQSSAYMVPKYAKFYKEGQQQGLQGAELASYTARMAEKPAGWDDPGSRAAQNYKRAWEQLPEVPALTPLPPRQPGLVEQARARREEQAAVPAPEPTPYEPIPTTEPVSRPTGDTDMGVGLGIPTTMRAQRPEDQAPYQVGPYGPTMEERAPEVARVLQTPVDPEIIRQSGPAGPVLSMAVAKAAELLGRDVTLRDLYGLAGGDAPQGVQVPFAPVGRVGGVAGPAEQVIEAGTRLPAPIRRLELPAPRPHPPEEVIEMGAGKVQPASTVPTLYTEPPPQMLLSERASLRGTMEADPRFAAARAPEPALPPVSVAEPSPVQTGISAKEQALRDVWLATPKGTRYTELKDLYPMRSPAETKEYERLSQQYIESGMSAAERRAWRKQAKLDRAEDLAAERELDRIESRPVVSPALLGPTAGALGSQAGTDEETTTQERLLRAATGAAVGRDGATTFARAGNINLAKYPDEVKEIISSTVNAAPHLVEYARRGVISDANMQEMARLAGASVESLIKKWEPGKAANGETIRGLQITLKEEAGKVRSALTNLAASDSTTNKAAAIEAMARYASVQEVVLGVTAEAGRALRVFRQEIGPDERLRQIVNFMAKQEQGAKGGLGGQSAAEEVAERLKNIDFEDPEAVAIAAQAIFRPNNWDKFNYYLYNALLSAPPGRIRDFVSTAYSTGTAPLERLAAAPLDVLAARKTGQRSVYLGEIGAEYQGMLHALGEGVSDSLSILRHGFTKQAAEQARDIGAVASREAYHIPFVPTRQVGASDAFWKALNRKAVIYADSVRIAKRQGLKGQEYTDEVARLRSNPTPEMIDHAFSESKLRVFQEDGAFVESVTRFKEAHPLARVVIPFHQTAINLMKYAGRRSPLAAISMGLDAKAGRLTQKEFTEGVARMSLGTAMTAGAVKWASEGNLTGAPPLDPSERDAFYRQGKQPYSIKLPNGEWRSYQFMPFAPLLSAAHDINRSMEEGHESAALAVVPILGMGIARSMTDQPFLQSVDTLFEAMQHPEKPQQLWNQFVRTAIPQGLQWAARAADPVIRDPEGLWEPAVAAIPGVSQAVPARYGALGRASRRQPGQTFATGDREILGKKIPEGSLLETPAKMLGSLDITKPAQTTTDPVEIELARLQKRDFNVQPRPVTRGVALTAIEGIEPVKIDRTQRADYQKLSGQLAHMQLGFLIQTDAYKNAKSDHERAAEIQKVFSTSRQVAQAVISKGLLERGVTEFIEKERRRPAS